MSDYEKNTVTDPDLIDFDDEYDAAPAGDDFDPVPDGRYQACVDKVERTNTMRGDPMLKWTLKIVGPTHQGRLLWRNNVITPGEGIKWLKKDLETCGLKQIRLSELSAHLDRLLDVTLEVAVKNKPGDDGKTYTSVYFNKRIKTAEEVLTEPSRGNDALSRF